MGLRFGTNFDDVQGSFGARAALPDVGVQDFEITKVLSGQQSRGKDEGEGYINLACTQMSGEAPGVKVHRQFLGLGTTPWANGSCQKAAFKGFIEAIGREDVLGPDGDSDMLIGTTFRAKVTIGKDRNGEDESRLYDIEPLSHAAGAASGAVNAPVNAPAPAPVAPAPAAAVPAAPAAPAAQAAPAAPVPPTQAPAAAPSGNRRRR